jgi:hypothetical protein
MLMEIQTTNSELILRFKNTSNIDYLQDVINIFKFNEIISRSQAEQKDIDALVKEIKKGRWEKTRKKIGL